MRGRKWEVLMTEKSLVGGKVRERKGGGWIAGKRKDGSQESGRMDRRKVEGRMAGKRENGWQKMGRLFHRKVEEWLARNG